MSYLVLHLYTIQMNENMKRTIVNPVISDIVTFLQTSEESQGAVTALEITLMPGGSNPLHYHKTYSETFTVMEGHLGLKTDRSKQKFLSPGESFTVQPMQLHAFFNPTNTICKFRVEIRPGHSGFEDSLRILYGLAADGLTNRRSVPRSLKHAAIIAEMSDMNMPGLLSIIAPVLKRMASKAKRTGEEQTLIDQYCK